MQVEDNNCYYISLQKADIQILPEILFPNYCCESVLNSCLSAVINLLKPEARINNI
jgi:hypothetical protein